MLPSKPHLVRGLSFNEQTGEKENPHVMWDSSPYTKLEKSRGMNLERANSFIGSSGAGTRTVAKGAVAVVDPFSTGAHLAAAVNKAGYHCIRVFSIWDSPVASLVQEGLDVDYCATVQHDDRGR